MIAFDSYRDLNYFREREQGRVKTRKIELCVHVCILLYICVLEEVSKKRKQKKDGVDSEEGKQSWYVLPEMKQYNWNNNSINRRANTQARLSVIVSKRTITWKSKIKKKWIEEEEERGEKRRQKKEKNGVNSEKEKSKNDVRYLEYAGSSSSRRD